MESKVDVIALASVSGVRAVSGPASSAVTVVVEGKQVRILASRHGLKSG